jgi:hypothetical protein
MMAALIRRAEELALARRGVKVQAVAEKLKALLGDAAVEVDEALVLVRGRGIIKRWLIDPSLRFLAGGLK